MVAVRFRESGAPEEACVVPPAGQTRPMSIFRRSRPSTSGIPDGDPRAKLAALADAFVVGAAEEGERFTFDIGDGARLDALLDDFAAGSPPPEVVHSMVVSTGAYVGEILVRAGVGRWIVHPDGGAGVLFGDELVCFPMNKVAKRISVGPEHSVAQLIQVALDGRIPPDAREITPSHHRRP